MYSLVEVWYNKTYKIVYGLNMPIVKSTQKLHARQILK